MATRETELPGVGTKHTLELGTGDELVVVEHRAGRWELARVDADGNTSSLLQLRPREAAELGRILSRADVSEEDTRQQLLLEEFGIEWAKVEEGSPLAGVTLQESGIRARSGANVVAVLRADESIASPSPDTRFRVGDTLVVMGQPSQVESFVKTFSSLPSDD